MIRFSHHLIRGEEMEIALFMIPVGAPMSAGVLEEIYAMGVKKAVVFGTCGVLEKAIDDCAGAGDTDAARINTRTIQKYTSDSIRRSKRL